MRRISILGSIVAAVSLLAVLGSAQDSHYWTYQYGTRSNLLGGAVIGSVLDLSGTYYNPGGLSLIETEAVELLMFAKVFHFPTISIEGLGPEENRLNSTDLGEAPSLFAGSIPIKGLGKHWLGYSYLTRSHTKLDLTGAVVGDYDFGGVFPDGIPTGVDSQIYERLNEPWYGLTWAYRLSDYVGIGISQYVTYRSHWIDFQTFAQALPSDGDVRLVLDSRQYKYQHYGLLWKIGAAFDFDWITLGLTITTPRVHIFSTARSGLNTTVVRQNPNEPDYMAVDFQDKLQANYRSPLSVGFGLTYKLGRTNLYASAEWFNGIDQYTVIKGEDFESQSTGEILPNEVTHEAASVLNVALGGEHSLNANFTLYGSFWTDYTSRIPDSATNLSIMDWDIYHFMGGTTISFKNSQLTLGMGYGYGGRSLSPGEGSLAGANPIAKSVAKMFFGELGYSYSSFVWVIGFSF
ncbi:MAG: OmpP1/FadL family transporter [Candidatus Aminicenantaceae bacterium]